MTQFQCNPNFKILLKLIFENCNQSKTCGFNIYQDDDNIDLICYKLSCISKFIQQLIKIINSNLTVEKQIQQIQRFKDNDNVPIVDVDTAKKMLQIMSSFFHPNIAKTKKKHNKYRHTNPVYNNCAKIITTKPTLKPSNAPSLKQNERDEYINNFYNSLTKEQLQLLKDILTKKRDNYIQLGGAENNNVDIEKLKKANQAFFKQLFTNVSQKIQEDKTYGTVDNVQDYKVRLDGFMKEAIQEMDVPEHLQYFTDNVSNLVDAIYPSNIEDFVRKDESIGAKVKNEFAEPFEFMELILFALSVMPIPVLNLIPDFLLIVHGILQRKRLLFVILSSIALMIKLMTLLFVDFGPLIKMFYMSKKIKNFNLDDLKQMFDKIVNDVLIMPGQMASATAGLMTKTILPAASMGQIRPNNLSVGLGKGNMTNLGSLGGAKDLMNLGSQLTGDSLKGMGKMGEMAASMLKLSPEDKKEVENMEKSSLQREYVSLLMRKAEQDAEKEHQGSNYTKWEKDISKYRMDPGKPNRIRIARNNANKKASSLQSHIDKLKAKLEAKKIYHKMNSLPVVDKLIKLKEEQAQFEKDLEVTKCTLVVKDDVTDDKKAELTGIDKAKLTVYKDECKAMIEDVRKNMEAPKLLEAKIDRLEMKIDKHTYHIKFLEEVKVKLDGLPEPPKELTPAVAAPVAAAAPDPIASPAPAPAVAAPAPAPAVAAPAASPASPAAPASAAPVASPASPASPASADPVASPAA